MDVFANEEEIGVFLGDMETLNGELLCWSLIIV